MSGPRSPRWSLLALAVSLPACAPQGIDTWPLPETGSSADFVTTVTITEGADTRGMVTVIHMDERHTATDRQGSLRTVETACQRVWGSIRGGGFRTPVEFDTSGGGRIHPLAKMFVDAMQRARRIVVDATGVVQTVQMHDGKSWRDPDEHERATTQLAHLQAPPLPAAVGTAWVPAVGAHECTEHGCVLIGIENTLTTVTRDTLHIESQGDLVDDEGHRHSIRRTAVLSRLDGWPLQADVSGASGGRDVRIETRRAPAR